MPSATLPPRSNLRPPPPSSPPRSKLPTEDINNNYISDKYKTFPRKLSPGDISAPQKPMPPIPNEQEDYEPVILSDPENYNALDEMNDSDSDEMYEEIDEHKIQSAFRPAPVTPPRKGSKDLQINSFPTPRSRLPSNPVPIKRPPKQLPVRAESVKEVKKERRQSDANVMKPDRAPPPPPPTSLSKTSTSDEINVKPRASSEEVVAPPRRCYPRQQSSPADIEVMKEMQGFLKSNQNGLQPPNKEVTNVSRSPIPKTATPLLTSSSRPLLSTSPRPPLLREEKRKYKSLEEDDVFSNMKTKTEEVYFFFKFLLKLLQIT